MKIPLFDMHTDILTSGKTYAQIVGEMQAGLADLSLCGASVAQWSNEESIHTWSGVSGRIEAIKALIGDANIRCSVENLGFIAADDIELLDNSIVDWIGLTWNYNNPLAGGALDDGRLTDRGKRVLRVMADQGIALDTAHLNRKSFFDACDNFSGKILCSHTCFNGCRLHPRNLSDDQIREILSRNGIVGVTLVGNFLTDGSATVDSVCAQIDYFVQKFGAENLGIGTDFYGTDDLPEGVTDYASMYVISDMLTMRGYRQEDIENIFHKNIQRFLALA